MDKSFFRIFIIFPSFLRQLKDFSGGYFDFVVPFDDVAVCLRTAEKRGVCQESEANCAEFACEIQRDAAAVFQIDRKTVTVQRDDVSDLNHKNTSEKHKK
jgi:hypothetical protein